MTYSRHDCVAKTDSVGVDKKEDFNQHNLKPHRGFAIILIVATVIAVFINFLPVIHFKPITEIKPLLQTQLLSKSRPFLQWPEKKSEEPVEESPKIIYFQARPLVEPTPPPAITSFKLFSFGRELGHDGFTTYVGDKPVVLSLEILPFMSHPPVEWSVSDSSAVSLSLNNNKKQCEFTALRDAGRIELTVSCNEVEIVMPVYVWGRQAS